ncbi:transposase [Streptomyces massasporeus]|uniref:transposase n=1 Tax=Streptomyces massasporeus TaxID=67324 RepID=UPI00369FA8EC
MPVWPLLVCSGLKGLPDAVETIWPRMVVQACIVHLIGTVCATSPGRIGTRLPAISGLSVPPRARPPPPSNPWSSEEKWGTTYPAAIKLWFDAWAEMVPLLSFDVEIAR